MQPSAPPHAPPPPDDSARLEGTVPLQAGGPVGMAGVELLPQAYLENVTPPGAPPFAAEPQPSSQPAAHRTSYTEAPHAHPFDPYAEAAHAHAPPQPALAEPQEAPPPPVPLQPSYGDAPPVPA